MFVDVDNVLAATVSKQEFITITFKRYGLNKVRLLTCSFKNLFNDENPNDETVFCLTVGGLSYNSVGLSSNIGHFSQILFRNILFSAVTLRIDNCNICNLQCN